MSLASYIGCNV
ncbi:Protein of unknown function [Bacillus mobilis]|nr:Protein of unknown function [Bacillus mobilis]SCN07888.1 Protein of unknown function [Bacillus wiedmannii]